MDYFLNFKINNPLVILGGELTNTVRWGNGTNLVMDLYDSETGQVYLIDGPID